MNKKILLFLLSLVFILLSINVSATCLTGSRFAISSQVTAENVCYTFSGDGAYSVKFDLQNNGFDIQRGIVELQPRRGDYLSFVSLQEQTCDALHKENVHKEFFLKSRERVTVTLTTPALPFSIYDLYLVSVDSCCTTNPACKQLPPFGWQTKIANDVSNSISGSVEKISIECRYDFECRARFPDLPVGSDIICSNPGTAQSKCTEIKKESSPEPVVETGKVTASIPQLLVQGNDVIIKTKITNSKSSKSVGLIELQPRLKSLATLSAFTVQKTSCNPDDPENVHGLFQIDSGATLDVTLVSEDLKPGSYDVYLVSTDKCCSDGSCSPIDPFGWQTKVASGVIIGKEGTKKVECNFDFECNERLGTESNCVNPKTEASYCKAVEQTTPSITPDHKFLGRFALPIYITFTAVSVIVFIFSPVLGVSFFVIGLITYTLEVVL